MHLLVRRDLHVQYIHHNYVEPVECLDKLGKTVILYLSIVIVCTYMHVL